MATAGNPISCKAAVAWFVDRQHLMLLCDVRFLATTLARVTEVTLRSLSFCTLAREAEKPLSIETIEVCVQFNFGCFLKTFDLSDI